MERPLQEQDMPELPRHLDPRQIVLDESIIHWSRGIDLLKSIQRAYWKLWRPQLFLYALFALMNLLGPVLVNGFVSRLGQGINTNHELMVVILFGVGIGLAGCIGGLAIQHYFYRDLGRNQIVINLLNRKIYKHSLVLTKAARERIPVGDIVNHMSTDSDAVAEVGNGLADIIYCFAMLLGALALMFYYLGATTWVAILLMSILAPLTRKVARDFTRYDEELMRWRDRRVTLMSQVLSAMRLVKFLAWEDSVEEEVKKVRRQELYFRKKLAVAELLVTTIYVALSAVILFAVFAVHAWRGLDTGPALIFTCVSLFALLEEPLAFISRSVSQLISGKVAADRIAKFLNEPVVSQSSFSSFLHPGIMAATVQKGPPLPTLGLAIEDLSVELGESRFPALQNISLTLNPGQSLAVIGSVGSGKSTLIQSILGEVQAKHGSLRFFGEAGDSQGTCRLGYVPQEAYILNGSVRENLLFGREDISETEVAHALAVTSLESDVSQMPGGLDAEIGERGINLSGGQKQRMSLARALLHRPQLVILDDPLSAVDGTTESQLVDKLIFGEWSKTTRVVITHRLQHLEKFDRIALLHHGKLLGVGTWKELRESSAEFRRYLDEAVYNLGDPEKLISKAREEVTKSDSVRLIEDEDRERGTVAGGIYWQYIRALGGRSSTWVSAGMIFLLVIAAASHTALPLMQKAWLAFASNYLAGDESGHILHGWRLEPLTVFYIYGILGLIVLGGALIANRFWLQRGLSAGLGIHDLMLKSILRAPLRFFDSTPVGRILQRFSRDTEIIDIQLQWTFETSIRCFIQVLLTLGLIVVTLPWIIIPLIPMGIVYYRLQKIYRASSREAKRMDSISRSPRYAHFKETLSGLTVIRAFQKYDWFLGEFYDHLSRSQRMFYGHYMINRWFSSRIPLLGAFVAVLTALSIVAAVKMGQMSTGTAGLVIMYALSFWGVLNWGIRIWSGVEANMTSLERVNTFTKVAQEQLTIPLGSLKHDEAKHDDTPEDWPKAGQLEFENVFLRYAENLPYALHGMNLRVEAGARVGIVGRTGSGKSTIIQGLFRLSELSHGRILIDGVDIATIPLPRLRRALAIIPQDPTLFLGSLRSNLDRYQKHSDADIWEVLDRTAMGQVVRALPDQLNTELSENGLNFSQGQRQLLCLARALLLKAKIIILDEATASVDVRTDSQVQEVLGRACHGMTMLVIAHRLGTVRDCNQIIEVEEGRIRNRIDQSKGLLEI